MKKKIIKIFAVLCGIGLLLGGLLFTLVWNGVIILNDFNIRTYPVKGVDVSSYQGVIDWGVLSSQDIAFAFIKATEGSTFVDPHFIYNYNEAQQTALAVGVYHFFSYDSAGQTQAKNFINTVTPFEGMLPPVIDLEFYGDKEKNPPDRTTVEKELNTMLSLLEAHYGQKPIIYATEKSYDLYLSDGYGDYDIWIRNVISKPKLADGRDWTFWQYTNRETLDGYKGKEKYIDVNVFYGDAKEFAAYLRNRTYATS